MLDHIEIYVSDINKTKEFYSKLLPLLGFVSYQNWNKGFSFKKDGLYIVFVQTEEKYLDYRYHRKHVGLNHLAFSVMTKEEVDLIRETMLPLCNELYSERYPHADKGNYSFFVEDPDRIKIEIVVRN